MIPPLKAKLWTARTPDRWHPVTVAGTEDCVALVAPDRRDIAHAIEALPDVQSGLVSLERWFESDPQHRAKDEIAQGFVRDALAALDGRR